MLTRWKRKWADRLTRITAQDRIIEGLDNQSRLIIEKAAAITQQISNSQDDLQDKFIGGLNNQSQLIIEKAAALVEGLNNQSQLIIEKAAALTRQITNFENRMHPSSWAHTELSAYGPEAASNPPTSAPVAELNYPIVNLKTSDNPVSAIMNAPEFSACVDFFSESPSAIQSLMSPNSQALLYSVIRNQKPLHVFEIGSYLAATSEAMARALHANQKGILHTVDPFGPEHVPQIIRCWPPQLQQHVRFYSSSSMAFFMEMNIRGIRPDLVLVDGDHDCEFAAFDIAAAARHMRPGGFIFIDNISQGGPYFAMADFLANNPAWLEYGNPRGKYRTGVVHDPHRTDIVNTDFSILRAPTGVAVGSRPISLGQQTWDSEGLQGLEATAARAGSRGSLIVQAVMRGFGDQPIEITAESGVDVQEAQHKIHVSFDPPVSMDGEFERTSLEIWLTWTGDRPLQLLGSPAFIPTKPGSSDQ